MAKKLSDEEKAKAKVEAKAKAEQKAQDKAAEDLKITEAAENLTVFPQSEKVMADKTDKFDSAAEELFKQHLNCNSLHFTNDGLAFFQHNDARNHASSLENKEVISKVRK